MPSLTLRGNRPNVTIGAGAAIGAAADDGVDDVDDDGITGVIVAEVTDVGGVVVGVDVDDLLLIASDAAVAVPNGDRDNVTGDFVDDGGSSSSHSGMDGVDVVVDVDGMLVEG